MTDPELVRKRLAYIETRLRELRTLARPELIAGDIKERCFVEHTLQLAIQAALDVASHIVSDERLGEPERNRDLFAHLAMGGWIAKESVPRLQLMTSFRNILVHGYLVVDLFKVREVVENHLGDLDQFVDAIRAKLAD